MPGQSQQAWVHEVVTKDNGPSLSYSTVISALAFAASVVYGVWALNQSQLANVNALIEQLRKDMVANDKRISEELTRREGELRTAHAAFQAELDRRREEFLGVRAFTPFHDRVLNDIMVMRNQLKTLEETRPTTGELQATSNALRDRIEKLYGMIATIEEEQRRFRRQLVVPNRPTGPETK